MWILTNFVTILVPEVILISHNLNFSTPFRASHQVIFSLSEDQRDFLIAKETVRHLKRRCTVEASCFVTFRGFDKIRKLFSWQNDSRKQFSPPGNHDSSSFQANSAQKLRQNLFEIRTLSKKGFQICNPELSNCFLRRDTDNQRQ